MSPELSEAMTRVRNEMTSEHKYYFLMSYEKPTKHTVFPCPMLAVVTAALTEIGSTNTAGFAIASIFHIAI